MNFFTYDCSHKQQAKESNFTSAINPILVLLCQEKVLETYSRGTIFDVVDFECLDKVMQMITIPGNPSYMMLEAC